MLPYAALALPEEERHQEGGIGALLRADGTGCFVRCLLPVQLPGGTELVVGTWLRISDGDLERARAVWEKPAFADLTLTGTLANSIPSLGDGLLGAEVTVMVRDPGEIPYVVASDSPAVARVLGEVFDRDRVLSTFGHPLPVAVRTRLDEWWSIERTAGLAARVVNGTSQFADSGRAVYADLLRDEARSTADARTPKYL